MTIAERALCEMLNYEAYDGPLRTLGMAEYPRFGDFVKMFGFLAYRERPDDVFFRENRGRFMYHSRFVAPDGSYGSERDDAGPSGTQGGNVGSVALVQIPRWPGLLVIIFRSHKPAVRVVF